MARTIQRSYLQDPMCRHLFIYSQIVLKSNLVYINAPISLSIFTNLPDTAGYPDAKTFASNPQTQICAKKTHDSNRNKRKISHPQSQIQSAKNWHMGEKEHVGKRARQKYRTLKWTAGKPMHLTHADKTGLKPWTWWAWTLITLPHQRKNDVTIELKNAKRI